MLPVFLTTLPSCVNIGEPILCEDHLLLIFIDLLSCRKLINSTCPSCAHDELHFVMLSSILSLQTDDTTVLPNRFYQLQYQFTPCVDLKNAMKCVFTTRML